MKLILLQKIALVIHGNALLRGHSVSDFYPDNNVFMFCISVQFFEGDKIIADNPTRWLNFQQSATAFRLRLIAAKEGSMSERISDHFVGGGKKVVIEVVKANRSEYWEAIVRIGNKMDPDDKIWIIEYRRLKEMPNLGALTSHNLDNVVTRFGKALHDIKTFAALNRNEKWTNTFGDALQCLEDIKVTRYPLDTLKGPIQAGIVNTTAQRLLKAVGPAWVFGGMGSWNDSMYVDVGNTQIYESVSNQLYDALYTVVEAAANSTAST